MTVLVQNTLANSSTTVSHWRVRTNELAAAMSTKAVTVDSNAAVGNAAVNGSIQTGNLHVNAIYGGVIGAQANLTLVGNVNFSGNATVAGNLRVNTGNSTFRVLVVNSAGGNAVFATRILLSDVLDMNVAASPSDGDFMRYSSAESRWKNESVVIAANSTPGGSNTHVQFNDSGALGGNAALTFNRTTGRLTASSVGTGNSTINVAVTGNSLSVSNTSQVTTVNALGVAVGDNARISATGLSVGNSTVNLFANSTRLSVSNSSLTLRIGPDALFAGSNSYLGPAGVVVGNSTVNAVVNSVAVTVSNSSLVLSMGSGDFSAGANVHVKPTGINVGAASLNSTVLSVSRVTATANVTTGNAIVTGIGTINTLSVTQNATVGGNEEVTGNLVIGGLGSISGSLAVGGNLAVDTDTFKVDVANDRVGVNILSPVYTLDVAGTGAVRLPVGTTAQRPASANGVIRFNTTETRLEFATSSGYETLDSVERETTFTGKKTFTSNSSQAGLNIGYSSGNPSGSNGDLWIDSSTLKLKFRANSAVKNVITEDTVGDYVTTGGIVQVTGTANTLQASYAGKVIETTSGSTVTITVPNNGTVAIATNTRVDGYAYGTGRVTFVPASGVTIRTRIAGANNVIVPYGKWSLLKRATNEWDLDGDLVPGIPTLISNTNFSNSSITGNFSQAFTISTSARSVLIAVQLEDTVTGNDFAIGGLPLTSAASYGTAIQNVQGLMLWANLPPTGSQAFTFSRSSGNGGLRGTVFQFADMISLSGTSASVANSGGGGGSFSTSFSVPFASFLIVMHGTSRNVFNSTSNVGSSVIYSNTNVGNDNTTMSLGYQTLYPANYTSSFATAATWNSNFNGGFGAVMLYGTDRAVP